VQAGRARKSVITLVHAFFGWALCFATIGIGRMVTSLDNALIAHAVAAPVIFFVITRVYMARFAYLTPLGTALVFTGFIVVTDFVVVALVINRSLDMFASALGTWIPFGSIFLSTWLSAEFTTGSGRVAPVG
jgi:uncharacterized membrane protein